MESWRRKINDGRWMAGWTDGDGDGGGGGKLFQQLEGGNVSLEQETTTSSTTRRKTCANQCVHVVCLP